jgi:precorrin-8X/cobalt-precorrin-8 methylmutase
VSVPAYSRDPEAIYAQSFATIRAEADLTALPVPLHPVAIRMIHACGMVDIAADIRASADLLDAATTALGAGAPILCDCEAVRAATIARHFPRNERIVTLNDPRVPALAATSATTRSAAAIDLWRDRLEGAIVLIGNAPTALFRLLELLDDGAPRPAAIIAAPVGFVGAAESKAELVRDPRGVPYVTLLGRRGGSAIASAALNAIAIAAA